MTMVTNKLLVIVALSIALLVSSMLLTHLIYKLGFLQNKIEEQNKLLNCSNDGLILIKQ